MKKKIKKSPSETAIRKAYEIVDSIGFPAAIAIAYGGESSKLMDVNVELLIGKSSSIKIVCENEDDAKWYRDMELSKEYSVDEAQIKYEEINDFQSTYRALHVKPKKTKIIITIRLNKKS